MASFPVGRSITIEELTVRPYDALARLREAEPVSWVPAIGGWLVTGRAPAIEAMRDAEAFTVDDPRFSTAAVLGPSMLSLDGPEHQRLREPFTPPLRPTAVRERFERFLDHRCRTAIDAMGERADLRSELAGPLAVDTVTHLLGLSEVTAAEVLTWYRHIAEAIDDVTRGRPVPERGRDAVARINRRVAETVAGRPSSLLAEIAGTGALTAEELGSSAAVLMFGAIETAEGMTANAFWHLLSHPTAWADLRADRSLVAAAVEESLRLEPAAAVVDRYATRDVEFGGVTVAAGDLVRISLLAANRDPTTFPDPDRFDLHRENARQHVSFVQGPHGCLGVHLTRMETVAAITTMLELRPDLALAPEDPCPPTGLVFRKPDRVSVAFGRR